MSNYHALSGMAFVTEASISDKKDKVSKKVEELRTKLKTGIDELARKSIPVKEQQQKKKKSFFSKPKSNEKEKKSFFSKPKSNEKEIREQKDKLWNVLLKLSFKFPLDELRILLTGRRHGVQLQELRSHFAGLRHELRLVADLFPLYKIIKEEDEDRKGSEEDVEENRKRDEMEKWEKLDKWITELATKVDNILKKQKRLLVDENVLEMKLAKKILNELEGDIKRDLKRINIDQDRTGGVLNDKLVLETDQANESKTELKESQHNSIDSEVKVVIKEIIVKIKANGINTKLLEVSKEVARKKEEIQLSHRKKLDQLASEKASTAAVKIEQSLLENYQLFTEFQNKYKNLGETTKLCFLCLAFFPEGVVIKKRLLIYWWIGEGLIDCTGKENKTMEDLADDVIDRLVDDGFLHIVDKMSGLEIDSYRMHPLVRSALVAQAKRVDFFDFEDSGMPTARVDSKSCKACLVDDSFIRQDRKPEYLLTYLADGEEEPKDDKKFQVDEKLRQLHAFFNHNRRLVDLKSNLFSKMKNLNVLHLGRWQNASRHHIEVETTDFLQGLKYMKHLKYISLQGVSQIRELPDLVCKLQFLRVLDLRACHNLQELPKDIGDVNLLTHLDISECYLLDGLPKSVANLKKLQVMKGFVIGDPKNRSHCTLEDLKGFEYLRKLTIHTSNNTFPDDKELEAFKNFRNLEKLSIAWGRGTLSAKPEDKNREDNKTKEVDKNKKDTKNLEGSKKGSGEKKDPTETSKAEEDPAIAEPKKSGEEVPKDDHKALPPTKANKEGSTSGGVKKNQKATNGAKKEGSSGETVENESDGSKETKPKNPFPVEFPERLVKLDLQCFPHAKCPKWLNPQNLTRLEKLYIRGGEMKTLGELQGRQWENVQILLLKYLSGFMLTWDQLLATFTELVYLEKVNCPRLTFYPCNERGEWKKE